ncbi:MAG: riboflavin biosynthesis protein RibF [Proteobacteria bacterium]|nr:riboflavin biosynthesis protein RibF [Pseudomonadota bacterium]
MQIIYGYQAVTEPLGPVVMTIGTYDGLHVGHRVIIEQVVRRARLTGSKAVVYSFYPPPWRVLGRGSNPYLILTLKDKIELLHKVGVDVLITEEFTPDIQQITHTDFTAQVLDGTFTPREIHVGYDFHFGEGRLGDWQYLREYFGDRVEVRPHGAVRVDGEIVGCTLVRRLVVAGAVEQVAPLLGRFHFLRGVVVRGRGRGAKIGVPTANIDTTTELLPPSGVYAVTMRVGDDPTELNGVANLGFRPTFAEKVFAIEVHLFDYDGDLYGERVVVSFVQRVRNELRFDSVDALIAQIKADVDAVRAMMPFPAPEPGQLSWDPKPA